MDGVAGVGTAPGPLPAGRSRDELIAEVRGSLVELPHGAAACVALSGGPDSTALAYLAAEARPDLSLTLVHVRHGLRDDAADRAMVLRHAGWLGLPLVERDVEVVRAGRGLEAAARAARYTALRAVAAEVGAAAILVGHTADDQAETVLLRLARGTGIEGLAGMSRGRGDLVRPLLRLRRSDLRRHLLLEGLPSVEDPTNEDPAVRRSVVRQRVLPALDATAPDPVGAITRTADLARDDAAALESWADGVAAALCRAGPVVAVPDRTLAAEPVAVARRVVRRMLQEVAGGPPPSAATVERVRTMAMGTAVMLSGGVLATAAGGWRAVSPPRLPSSDPVAVAVPGTTSWPPAGIAVHAVTPSAQPPPWGGPAGTDRIGEQTALELVGVWAPPVPPADVAATPPGGRPERLHVVLPSGLEGLGLRHRLPGDRLRTPAGTRRLKDVLVDAGVPRAAREVWPVVVASGGRLVWVPGVAADVDVLAAGRQAPGVLLAVTRMGADHERAPTGV